MKTRKLLYKLTLGALLCSSLTGSQLAFANEMPPAPPTDADGNMLPPPGGMMGEQKTAKDFSATRTIDNVTATDTGKTYDNNVSDNNTVLVRNNGKFTLGNARLTKTGDSTNADNSNFTGQNAVFLAADSVATINNSTIESDADGANAIFATGKSSIVTVNNVKIHTRNNSSRGLDATYNGNIIANNVDITTEGAHCGALATDRGEGNVTVSNATLKTSGDGSPCVYSTGDIRVADSTGEATGSEIAVVEGKNSISLTNVNFTGHKKHGIMLYQSFSGDAGVGMATFVSADSTLNNLSSGPMFFVTNTRAMATLENTQLKQKSNTLVKVAADHWGKTGANGGDFALTATNQQLNGDIIADKLSTVYLGLKNNSSYTGAINKDKQAKAINLELDESSTLTLTADSYVSTILDAKQDFSNINSNGHTLYYIASKNKALHSRTISLKDGGKLAPL